jgi:glucosyl-dolichyl phosphate glucuronosyltransferase
MELSVIICTWNRAESLRHALASLQECRLPQGITWEVIIVDNNSTDETAAVCEEFLRGDPQHFRRIVEKRQGKSFALNTGIENARGTILAFTDDDVIVDSGWLDETLRIFDTTQCVGVAGKIVPLWNSKKPSWLTSEGPYKLHLAIVSYDLGDDVCEIRAPALGANISLKKEVFEKYGMYRTDLGPTAGSEVRGEDTEFCWRLLRAGERIIYAPKAIVFHPVDMQRIDKGYFQAWYYGMGQSRPRIERATEAAVRYFGVPRYMFRWYFRDLLLWLTSLTPRRRFYYKLQFYATNGQMMEDRRIWQNQQHQPQETIVPLPHRIAAKTGANSAPPPER